VGRFEGEPSLFLSWPDIEHKTEHKTDRKTAPRATGLEMALEAHFKKEIVSCREGLESRSNRLQTRCDFSNLDPADFGALGGARA
jgi:hypothetical protein